MSKLRFLSWKALRLRSTLASMLAASLWAVIFSGLPTTPGLQAQEPSTASPTGDPDGQIVPTAAQLQLLPTGPAAIPAPGEDEIHPLPNTEGKLQNLIADVLEAETALDLRMDRSKLIRLKQPVSRTSITDPSVAELVQYSPTEFEIIGLEPGETGMTFWFGDQPNSEVLRYLVRVTIDTSIDDERRLEYNELETMINEMFPNSLIQIFPLADKVVVRGEARDTEEAVQISSVLRAQGYGGGGGGGGMGGGGMGNSIVQGPIATPFPGRSRLPQSNLVNLIHVPGEQQVMLKVRIAQLNRTAVRKFGIDWSVAGNNFMVSQMFGNGGSLSALLDNNDVKLLIQATSSNDYSKVLAEPNLITLNGQTATFISGGQFAIPTAVGIGGIGAAGTSFQGYGTQLLFTPTILDKDRIRLRVVPTYSQLDKTNTVNGIPGLTTRSASTTVDMREGQWLAIAGLLEDDQTGSSERFALLGSIPVLGVLFRNNSVTRQETELLILVSPELVHPLEQEQLPLLIPGMEVTEPNEFAFYWKGQIEGDEGCNFRSTVVYNQWIKVREAVREAKRDAHYLRCEQYYVVGPHGFSD